MARDAAEILEPFRKYLMVLAELHLDRRLRGKLDASDVVQQTMLRAYSALAELRDPQPEVLVAWLRRILARTLADAVKHYERDKRDVALERSLEADLDRSASGFAAWLAADQTSPSGQGRAERGAAADGRGPVGPSRADARSGGPEALPGLDPPPDRRPDRPIRPGGGLAPAARAGRLAETDEERPGVTARRRVDCSLPRAADIMILVDRVSCPRTLWCDDEPIPG